MNDYLANATGPVPLVLELRIAHDSFRSSSDPNLNGHLYYPNDIDRSLNEAAADKIRKYRTDYNNNPPNVISFMSSVASTSERIRFIFRRGRRGRFLQDFQEREGEGGSGGDNGGRVGRRTTLQAKDPQIDRCALHSLKRTKCIRVVRGIKQLQHAQVCVCARCQSSQSFA